PINCGLVLFTQCGLKVRGQGSLSLFIEASKSCIRRSVVIAEKVGDLLQCKWTVKIHVLAGQFELGASTAQVLANRRFVSRKERRTDSGRRRNMPACYGKHLADESFARPIGHGDRASGTAHAQEFRRDEFRTRREHGAEVAGYL